MINASENNMLNTMISIDVTKEDYDEFKNLDKSMHKDFIQNLIDKNKQASLADSKRNNNILGVPREPFNVSNEAYVASMLLKQAVLDKNVEMSKLLLIYYKADPRILDNYDFKSAITSALYFDDDFDLKFLKIIKRNMSPEYKKQSIKGDSYTLSCIYHAAWGGDYEDPEDVFDIVNDIYTDLDCIY